MTHPHDGDFFADFELEHIAVSGGQLRLRRGGSGFPLLLLHGNPQTHAMWHAVAPELARTYAVVCPDLPGYGGSFKPGVSVNNEAHAKRTMAAWLVELMLTLGHERFAVIGHDRGARVAHRLALDHADRVTALSLLDIVPTLEHFERTDMDFALGYYHWFWLAQPHPFPETLINAMPVEWFRGHTSREPKDDGFFHPQALADYHSAVRDPDTVTGICEDYRAAAGIDLVHDRDSRRLGHRLRCPLQVLWGARAKIGRWYAPLDVWAGYCESKPLGHAVNSGHYLAEEAPTEVLAALMPFLRSHLAG